MIAICNVELGIRALSTALWDMHILYTYCVFLSHITVMCEYLSYVHLHYWLAPRMSYISAGVHVAPRYVCHYHHVHANCVGMQTVYKAQMWYRHAHHAPHTQNINTVWGVVCLKVTTSKATHSSNTWRSCTIDPQLIWSCTVPSYACCIFTPT